MGMVTVDTCHGVHGAVHPGMFWDGHTISGRDMIKTRTDLIYGQEEARKRTMCGEKDS